MADKKKGFLAGTIGRRWVLQRRARPPAWDVQWPSAMAAEGRSLIIQVVHRPDLRPAAGRAFIVRRHLREAWRQRWCRWMSPPTSTPPRMLQHDILTSEGLPFAVPGQSERRRPTMTMTTTPQVTPTLPW